MSVLSDCSGRDPEPTEVRAVAEVVNGFRGVTLPDETLDEFRYLEGVERGFAS